MPKTNLRSTAVFRRGNGVAAAQPPLLVTVDDRLPSDHFVRLLLPLVEEVLGSELRRTCSKVGGFPYDPVCLLCVWLYGYMLGIRTSRRLEEMCRYDSRFEFLCRSCRPDHTTLSRFRQALGESMDELLARVCQAAQSEGLLSRKTKAVDGTKMAARTSQWRRARKEADQAEALEQEATTMVSHGQYLVGYNVQAAADTDSKMVLGYVVSTAAEDRSQMEGVLDAVERQSGQTSAQVVADSGYDSSINALALEEAKIEAYLPTSRKEKRPVFEPDGCGNLVCAAGHVAKQRRWVDKRRGDKLYNVFRVSKCAGCPLQKFCPGKGKQRLMRVLACDSNFAKHQANARCKTAQGKSALRARGPTIEFVFAVVKGRYGLRRFVLGGTQGAAKEFGLAVLAHNFERFNHLRGVAQQAACAAFWALRRLWAGPRASWRPNAPQTAQNRHCPLAGCG